MVEHEETAVAGGKVSNEVVVLEGVKDLTTSIVNFEELMLGHVSSLGLPREEVLIGVQERVQVLSNLQGAISELPAEYRANSMYLSKFALAVSAGLFDAALNYLWDETISELRRRIVDYDLSYFFDLAISDPEKRKDLQDPEDLAKITDDELIRAAATVGFISAVGQRQLDVVRFMRNHASAAHPNQHELKPFQLLGYVQTCIAEVILLPESQTMVDTSRLLRNVREEKVTRTDAAGYESLFAALRFEQVTALANGLFGIYSRPDSTTSARDNIRLLVPYLWPHIPEKTRATFGVKYMRFKANLDVQQASLAREFLETVGGASYLPTEVRVAEIAVLVDRLLGAHEAYDNFYNEPPIAKQIQDYIGDQEVPAGVRERYVAVLVDVFLGRRTGIGQNAKPVYQQLLDKLTPEEAALALLEVSGPNLAGTLSFKFPQGQLTELMAILQPKLVGEPSHALWRAIDKFTGPAESMMLESRIKRRRDNLMAFLN
ncbi:hypothetical protein [Curtobacterium sp. SGAir0471]|uniref:hypothetical protein n=1 Tax=Curtobacterium sp. SGAir0471 TaxID=2070337 RepID=UPI0010F84822|nr:hypothetical protein [Curtobacterium sp. SGAir0471]